jgi:hypothetical protein
MPRGVSPCTGRVTPHVVTWIHCRCRVVSTLIAYLGMSTFESLVGVQAFFFSTSSSTLDWGEWLASSPGRYLPPGKRLPVPIVQEAGWAPEPVWTQRLEEKSFCLCRGSNLDRPVIQSVVRHYTDLATPAAKGYVSYLK